MPELRDDVLDEAGHRSKYLTARELLSLIERHHPRGEAGVDRELYEAYTEAVAEGTARSTDEFTDMLSANLTSDEGWAGADAVYELETGKMSVYPKHCHEHLGGVGDPREHLRYLTDETDQYDRQVPEQTLLHMVTVVGGLDYETAKAELESLRDEGKVLEDADQHPDANVYLPEDDPGYLGDKDVQ